MLTRAEITKGISLRLNTTHLGHPAGLIGIVYALGTDQTGDWYFQLRYVNAPPGTKTRGGSRWSLNLHEEDVEHFERIDTWDQVQKLLGESGPPRKPRREDMTRSASMSGKVDPNQLQLFEDFSGVLGLCANSRLLQG
jgi:hypothetical protein